MISVTWIDIFKDYAEKIFYDAPWCVLIKIYLTDTPAIYVQSTEAWTWMAILDDGWTIGGWRPNWSTNVNYWVTMGKYKFVVKQPN